MLSAIAARKAAQATSRGTSGEIVEPTFAVQTPSAKRKPLSQKRPDQSWKKKKQKDKDKEKQLNKTRYFQEPQKDLFEVQEDVMVIDSDEEGMSEDQELHETSIMPAPQTSKHRWFSSGVPDDSSDEESDEDNGNREGDVIMDIHTSTPLPSTDNPYVLSTFQSTHDRNVFFLNSHQMHNLHASSFSEGPGTLLALEPGETLCFLGAYTFCVLQGSVCFGGVNMSPSMRTHRVFAPRSSPLPILEGLAGIDKIRGLERKLPEQIRWVTDTHITLVLLQDSRTGVEGLGRVCRTFNGMFEPSRWQKNVLGTSLQLSEVHMITHQTKDVQVFRLPSSWTTSLASIPISTHLQNGTGYSGGVHLIKGPKKSGKSTFARTLVNRLLTQYHRVAFLECDPGQSEFTPGGMIALNVVQDTIFGPPFTHPTLPVTAHYLGATSPRSSPSYYIAAVQAALDAYRLDVQLFSPTFAPNNEDAEDLDEDDRIRDFIPLVINTMGWTKGLGADLNQKIEDMAQPTDVYEIQADGAAFESQAWFPSPLPNTTKDSYSCPDPGHDVKLHLLTAIPPSVLSPNYTAADYRALSIMSYFHAVFPSTPHVQADTLLSVPLSDASLTAHIWDTSLPLLAQPPYEVDSRVFRGLVLTGAGSEDVVPAEVGIVLNSAVVGLVACQFDSELDPGGVPLGAVGNQKTHTGIPYTQGRAPPSPAMSSCLGIALVRSTSGSLSASSSVEPLPSDPQVDMQVQMQMHILTPLPPPYLSQVKIVVKGEMELPVWGWLDHRLDAADGIAGVEQGKVPYLQLGKGPDGAVGGVRRRVRRNLMRRAQM